jgi:hypothetical protein
MLSLTETSRYKIYSTFIILIWCALLLFLDIDECEDPKAYHCYGTCLNFPGSFQCQCPNGTYGNPTKEGGCMSIIVKNSSAGDKACTCCLSSYIYFFIFVRNASTISSQLQLPVFCLASIYKLNLSYNILL